MTELANTDGAWSRTSWVTSWSAVLLDDLKLIRQLGGRGGGHGLRLVDHLCARRGASAGSTRVWAELPLVETPA